MDLAVPAEAASGAAKRRLGPIGAVVSVVIFAVGSWFAWPRMHAWSAERRVVAALHEVVACLGVDSETSDAALRRRAIRAEMTGNVWPEPCRQPLSTLVGAARRARVRRDACEDACCLEDTRCVAFERLESAAATLKATLQDRSFLEGAAGRLVELAMDLGYAVGEAHANVGDSGHLLASDVPRLTHGTLARAALCRMSESQWWLMMHHARLGATLCQLGFSQSTARCRALPVAIPTSGELFLVDGGLAPMPRLLAGQGDAWAWYAPAGKRVAVLPPQTVGATALPTGEAAALVRADGGYSVIVAGERRATIRASSLPLLYGGYAIAQLGRELSAFSIDDGERVALGQLASSARATMRGCMGSDVVAVRVRDDERKGDVILTQRHGTWSLWPLPSGVPPMSLSCHGDNAHLTWLETVQTERRKTGVVHGTYRAHDVVCTVTGCRERVGELSMSRHAMDSRFFIAGLGDNVAVIWRSGLGDVRARIAPPEKLSQRAPIAVVEDETHGGFAWDTVPMRLLSAERSAVFLIEDDGVRGILIDARGARAVHTPSR